MQFIGWGSSTYGNNAALTVSVHPNTQVGDHVFFFAGIREDAGSFSAPGGWQSLAQAGYLNGSVEAFIQIFHAIWTGSNGTTFTPVGGGSNDTTYGITLTIRGDFNGDINNLSDWRVDLTDYVGSSPTIYSTRNAIDEAARGGIRQGDMLVTFSGWADDVNTAGSNYSYYLNGLTDNLTFPYTEGINLASTLGADAGGRASFAICPVNIPATGVQQFQGQFTSTLTPWVTCGVFIRAAPSTNSWSFEGSGGAKAGGAADTLKETLTTVGAFEASGGARAGGAADTSSIYLNFVGTFEASGGAKAGGVGTTVLSLLGLRIRHSTVFSTSVCTTGALSLTIPATVQVGDLMILHIAVSASTQAATSVTPPAGWTAFDTWNGFLSNRVLWKKAEASDIGAAVSVTFPSDSASSGKRMALRSFYNVDWSFNNGSPFGTPYQISTTIGVVQMRLPAIDNYENSTLTLASGANGVTSAQTAESISFGYSELYDVAGGCSWSAGLHAYLGYTPGRRSSTTMPGAGTMGNFGSVVSSGQYVFSIATLAGGTSVAYQASGGAVLGGVGKALPPGALNDDQYAPQGGGVAGGSALASFEQSVAPVRSWGVTSSWAAQASRQTPAGWYVTASVGATPLRLAQLLLRRDKARVATLTLHVLSTTAPCAAGAIVGLAVIQRAASGAEYVDQAWTLLAGRVRQMADGLWLVEGTEQGIRLGGAQKQAPAVMARMQDGIRVPADFDIVPGDSVDGAEIKSASTSIVANGSWFTEVRYG